MVHSVPMPGPAYRVTLSPAACGLDMGDGSERGEYVSQDYLLQALGRPHRAINLMYCYYPYDKGWPLRASVAFKAGKIDRKVSVFSYPYDDYFPYRQRKHRRGPVEPFSEIRDVRRHGQDVTLTLTIDLKATDGELKGIARELRPYGRLRLRINHECDGFWFAFNKRHSHKEITAFFIRFHGILKSTAPNVETVCCWGAWDRVKKEVAFLKDLSPMLFHADHWSVDKYLSLHYRWPVTVCEEGDKRGSGWNFEGLAESWNDMKQVQRVFAETTGLDRPLEICEFNADGDVGGREVQARLARGFYRKVLKEKPKWISGITYYQFRDRGRLGLEREDPNNPEVGIPTEFLGEYRGIIQDPYFKPGEKWDRAGGRALSWTASDDAEGLGWKVRVKSRPAFFELLLPRDLNLVARVGRLWFYKKPGVDWVDATAGAQDWKGREVPVALFAPPRDGTNPQGTATVRTLLAGNPGLRVRYSWKTMKF